MNLLLINQDSDKKFEYGEHQIAMDDIKRLHDPQNMRAKKEKTGREIYTRCGLRTHFGVIIALF